MGEIFSVSANVHRYLSIGIKEASLFVSVFVGLRILIIRPGVKLSLPKTCKNDINTVKQSIDRMLL